MLYYTVQAGLVDPKMMSTKGEAHPGPKRKSLRWTQLWVVSPIDMLVTALSGKQLNDNDKGEYLNDRADAYLCGLGHDEDGIARVGRAIERQFPDGNVLVDGAQNCDFSKNPCAIVMAGRAQAFTLLRNKRAGMAYFEMVDAFCHLGHVLECGSSLLQSVWYGQEPSGGLKTTTNNNRDRTNGLKKAGATTSSVAGDDNLCWPPPGHAILAQCGMVIKPASTQIVNWRKGEPVVITSHGFEWHPAVTVNGTPIDAHWTADFLGSAKTFNNLLLVNPERTIEHYHRIIEPKLRGVAWACRNSPTRFAQLERLSSYSKTCYTILCHYVKL